MDEKSLCTVLSHRDHRTCGVHRAPYSFNVRASPSTVDVDVPILAVWARERALAAFETKHEQSLHTYPNHTVLRLAGAALWLGRWAYRSMPSSAVRSWQLGRH